MYCGTCLHCLRVPGGLQYEIALLTYRFLHDMAPPYLGPFVRAADLPSRRGLYGQQAPVAWWSRRSSVPQSVAGPFGFLDRGCGTSCPAEEVATAGAVTASVAASTERTPLGEVISRYSNDRTSLSTPSMVLVVVLAT